MTTDTTLPAFLDSYDLASLRLGGSVLLASDDFFAEKENLLLAHPAEWREHEYTDKGKWMDGWESRRKRTPGHTSGPGTPWNDWAIIRLGVPGILRGAVVDTAFFRGNFPESCSLEGTAAPIDAHPDLLLAEETEWVEALPRATLQGNSKNLFAISCPYAFTHVRLRIFPDGGVARLRLHGDIVPDWPRRGHAKGEIDLAAAEHGGDVLIASDMFFGERRNLVMPGRAKNMSDGWETRRRRGPGSDWAIVRLGATGTISRLEIDTNHFKGNFPDLCQIEACLDPEATTDALAQSTKWRTLLGKVKLQAHTRHWFEGELAELGPVSHVRINVYPDGGVSRLRVYGSLDEDTRLGLGVRRLDTLTPRLAKAAMWSACASTKWVTGMLDARPFGSVDALLAAANRVWATTGPSDWKEAFLAHPRIGEQRAASDRGPGNQGAIDHGPSDHGSSERSAQEKSWSKKEQSGMAAASPEIAAELADVNKRYEERFGFTYIVCATGKTAAELLDIAKGRLDNAAEEELEIASKELLAIAILRLRKLVTP